MKELISHIEFLILEHEYVIIPDLGGFVLNKESAYIDPEGRIIAPTLSLGFNAELKYNDGLLAESYMQRYTISYDSACRQISETVKQIKNLLTTMHAVDFGNLGSLTFADGKILFNSSSKNFSNHPGVWGCSNVNLKRLAEIAVLNESTPKARKIRFRQIASAVGVAAVTLLLFSTLPFEDNILQRAQQSGFVSDIPNKQGRSFYLENIGSNKQYNFDNIIQQKAEMKAKADSISAINIKAEVAAQNITKPQQTQIKAQVNPSKYYYIVVGSDTEKLQANRLAVKFKKSGFNNAAVVDSPNRYRVYVASFTNKDEANTYLSRFRAKNPEHKDAWLFTQRR